MSNLKHKQLTIHKHKVLHTVRINKRKRETHIELMHINS